MPAYSGIPQDSKYLEFPRSDGNPDKLPTDKLDPTPDAQNEVNYMRPIAHDEPLCIKWRMQIGSEVAKLLGHANHKKYVIKSFPQDYVFYHHNKGPVRAPRTDPYLFGSPSGRFRSPPEFIPHAYWLLTDDTLNRKNCGCKYCTSTKNQKQISQNLGLKPVPAAGSSSNPTTVKPKVRQVIQPRKRPPVARGGVNPDRTSDLRASRCFRLGELVWCALSPVIQGANKDERIEFWPGLVEETRLKSDVLPHAPGEQWRVQQSTVYKVKLLGVMHSYVLPEDAILPYQAYGPSMDLIEHLRLAGNPTLIQDWQRLSEFRPNPSGAEVEVSTQHRFVEGATPFALAIQIAAHLVRMWTPSDEWKFHGEGPVQQPAASSSTDGPQTADITETRHQGLWWGAERIWVDELVRLQPGRAQVAPQGSQIVYRASPRADGRGVLFRINSIISTPQGAAKDALRECKVAGVLYEVADETYEEESATESIPRDGDAHASEPTRPTSSAFPNTNPSENSVDKPLAPENGAGPSTDIGPVPNPSEAPPPPVTPLSHPNPPPYALPEPPRGFKFRPIMKPGFEIVLDVSLVAGRYYPRLFAHPLLQNALADVSLDDTRVPQLTALCGLLAGAVNSMECVDWAASRLSMIKQADVRARQELYQHWHPSPQDHGEDVENVTGEDVEMQDTPSKDVEMQDVQPS